MGISTTIECNSRHLDAQYSSMKSQVEASHLENTQVMDGTSRYFKRAIQVPHRVCQKDTSHKNHRHSLFQTQVPFYTTYCDQLKETFHARK